MHFFLKGGSLHHTLNIYRRKFTLKILFAMMMVQNNELKRALIKIFDDPLKKLIKEQSMDMKMNECICMIECKFADITNELLELVKCNVFKAEDVLSSKHNKHFAWGFWCILTTKFLSC